MADVAGSPSWSPAATERDILAGLVKVAASVRKIAAKFGVSATTVQPIKALPGAAQAPPSHAPPAIHPADRSRPIKTPLFY